jgi:ATP-binding cassette subfamily C protein
MNSTFKESKKLGGTLRLINQEMISRIMEQLDGVKEAKSYGIEAVQIGTFEETAEKTRRNLTDFTKLQSKTTLLYNIIAAVVISVLFYSSVVYLKIAPAALLIIIYVFARLWPSFTTLQNNFQNVIAMIPSFSALMELMENLDAHCETIYAETNPEALPNDASVCFENVCFHYEDSDAFELKNLNFEIYARKITAFVGKSGAGKSTIIDLLIGLLKPTEGRITAGGKAIDENMLMQWRQGIAYVPQDPFLFNSTIRENLLRYTPGATDAEIKEALKLSAALEFIEKLPQGVDTVIGDSGVRLSGGERQRIVLARALLRKPRYLVLDEATSSLDNENEYRIQKAVESLSGKLTVVIIAHRLSTIRNADNIIVIEGGRLVEQGTYAELKQNKDSFLSKSLEICR